MKIILDSNVLFSALIRDSLTRKLILNYKELFLFPEFIFQEMNKHKKELMKKSKMNSVDFNSLLEILLRKVIIVPNEILLKNKNNAIDIVKEIDLDDAIFFACALTYKNSIIWSDDKKLKTQKKIIVINTTEMMNLMNNLIN